MRDPGPFKVADNGPALRRIKSGVGRADNRLLRNLALDRDHPAGFDGERDTAALQLQCVIAEHFAPLVTSSADRRRD